MLYLYWGWAVRCSGAKWPFRLCIAVALGGKGRSCTHLLLLQRGLSGFVLHVLTVAAGLQH